MDARLKLLQGNDQLFGGLHVLHAIRWVTHLCGLSNSKTGQVEAEEHNTFEGIYHNSSITRRDNATKKNFNGQTSFVA